MLDSCDLTDASAPLARVLPTEASTTDASMPIIAITTRSSMRVNPADAPARFKPPLTVIITSFKDHTALTAEDVPFYAQTIASAANTAVSAFEAPELSEHQ